MPEPTWTGLRDGMDRRRVSYWVLTTDPTSRTAALGAIRRDKDGDHGIAGWFTARTYEWPRGKYQGSPDGIKLGSFPSKRAAMRAVEEAVAYADA